MRAGNVVLLNGPSSAGKTTIAKALQEIMETPYIHTGIDHFCERVPTRFLVSSDGIEPASAPGWLLVFGGGTVQSFLTAEGMTGYTGATLTEVRIGPLGLHLLAGMYRSIVALAAAGVDVIVDDVIYDPRVLRLAVEALCRLPVLAVGVRCPKEVVMERERARGDRGIGGAATFYDLVHAHALYDMEVDTSVFSARACAEQIKEALQSDHPRIAFRRMGQQVQDGIE